MGEYEAKRFHDAGIDHRCGGGSSHRHYTAARVEELIGMGVMEWVGKHKKIAAYTQSRTWKKTICPGFGPTMQLVNSAGRL